MPLAEMVTWELAEYRERLEDALALDPIPTYYLPREQLQKQLDAVLADHQEPAHRSDTPCHWPQCKITINSQDTCDEGRDCK